MTTDELVAQFIAALCKNVEEAETLFDKHVRKVRDFDVRGDLVFTTYSVALNDETRDIRFVTSVVCGNDHSECVRDAWESRAVTRVVTEYHRV